MRPHAARHGELLAWLASAREWLAEFAEEGIERIEPRRPAIGRVDAGVAARGRPGDRRRGGIAAARACSTSSRVVERRNDARGGSRGLGDCTRCRLCEQRTQIVFGDGNPHAELMFVGEGPGEPRRTATGLPFVGRAGELLTAMIEKGLGIPRRDVYICNIVKCRPPGNRTPLADEARTCGAFLDGQIAAVRPKVIVALGKPAASLLLGRDVAITRVRGTWQSYKRHSR